MTLGSCRKFFDKEGEMGTVPVKAGALRTCATTSLGQAGCEILPSPVPHNDILLSHTSSLRWSFFVLDFIRDLSVPRLCGAPQTWLNPHWSDRDLRSPYRYHLSTLIALADAPPISFPAPYDFRPRLDVVTVFSPSSPV